MKVKIFLIYYRKKSCDSGLFAPYLLNVATKEYCSIYLEMGFISEEFCVKILVAIVAAEK